MVEYTENGFPYIKSEVFTTSGGVRYLKTPGMAMINRPDVDISGMKYFLEGFPEELGYMDYLNDPVELTPPEKLSKTAGQLCYMSFGPERTMNADAGKYFDNNRSQKHGSIMEHAVFSMLLWGVSRSFTHEMVRHRAGVAFSQVSQRYVGDNALRFVERPEMVADRVLHWQFLRHIDRSVEEYIWLTKYLYDQQSQGVEILSADRKTDLKKKVRQCARADLPNETEAPILVSGNVRAWRNILEQRVSVHAEVEIRRIVYNVFLCLEPFMPNILSDYKTVTLADGTLALASPYSKV